MEIMYRNLMFDLASRKTIYDAETNRVVSNDEANDKLREFCLNTLGLNEKSSKRDIMRALKRPAGVELFEVIEEILDEQISTGWHDSEFYNDYVENKNMKDGDVNEFYSEKDIILTVTKVSGDHHDLIMQKLGEGETITIPTSVYAVKVGTDIRLFLTGRRNWNDFIDAVTRAFTKQILDEMYTAVMNASTKIPVAAQFNKTGALSSTTKDTMDQLIADVSMANDNCEVVIMGTKLALKKFNALSEVDWRSETLKDQYCNTGILGSYEGTAMVEIPNRFANNDTANRLVDDKALLIMPVVDNKFVKFVDYGETTLEETTVGDTMNDQQSYEVQRRMGVGVVITKYFGKWELV